MRWSARFRYSRDSNRAAIRAEELAALTKERPGKLLKILTAMTFATVAVAYRVRQTSSRDLGRVRVPETIGSTLRVIDGFPEAVRSTLLAIGPAFSTLLMLAMYYPFMAVEKIRLLVFRHVNEPSGRRP